MVSDALHANYHKVWRPYTQMQTAPQPLEVSRTAGSKLYLRDGRELIDGIASWWTACHGYNHPHIVEALQRQATLMPHVMFGGLAHEGAYRLAGRLSALMPQGLEHVFFAESGSVSVEIALKMALQFQRARGQGSRTKFVHFAGSYHGDTFATMALCDPDEGMHAYFGIVMPANICLPLPETPEQILTFQSRIEADAHQIAGVIVEPLVQGAGGMKMHAPEVLQTLRRVCDQHGILLIFDEIFTGFGRTGTLFAHQQAGVSPDIITLSKALTGGVLPLSAAIAHRHVYESFLSDRFETALMHGPTYMANPMAIAAANASLDVFATIPWAANVARLARGLAMGLAPCRDANGVKDVRILGAIGCVEFTEPIAPHALIAAFAKRGCWIKPFGNIIYLTPALNMDDEDLATLCKAIVESVCVSAP